jgi:hypothetical protein
LGSGVQQPVDHPFCIRIHHVHCAHSGGAGETKQMAKEEVEFDEVDDPRTRVGGMDLSKYDIDFDLFPVIEYIVELEKLTLKQHESIEYFIGMVQHYEQRLGIEDPNPGHMPFEEFHRTAQEHRAKVEE